MKLYSSPTSPYARKVRISAHELGLSQKIELISIALSPINPHDALRSSNPLGKLPALITDEGEALYDSPVICEYLDSLAGGNRIFPPLGPARWTALRRQALADGILDAAVLTRYEETLRPKELRWQQWVDGQWLKMRTGLDALERETLDEAALDIGTISIACALGYLDFRFASEGWRTSRPRLAAWAAAIARRPSLATTLPA
ncbi:MAG TPA: glutathione S-transferase N-terminal domain-containing protein [Steroidobacteraceae bacterium]|nr:glutathione S-transferase N-terminal domain-containing protein [Steroidobacteraceae bacterium]